MIITSCSFKNELEGVGKSARSQKKVIFLAFSMRFAVFHLTFLCLNWKLLDILYHIVNRVLYLLWGRGRCHFTVTNAALGVRGCWLHETVADINSMAVGQDWWKHQCAVALTAVYLMVLLFVCLFWGFTKKNLQP